MPKPTSPLFMNRFNLPVPKLKYSDIYMLSRKELIDKGLKSSYSLVEFCNLLTHLSFENKYYSKVLAKRALIGLNKASGDET